MSSDLPKLPTPEDWWAKTDGKDQMSCSLLEHSVHAWAVASLIEKNLGGVTALPQSLLPWAAAVHDIGKLSPGFAVKCQGWLRTQGLEQLAASEGWREKQGNHGLTSGQFLAQAKLLELSPPFRAPSKLLRLIAGHHGRIADSSAFTDSQWDSLRRNQMHELRSSLWDLLCNNLGIAGGPPTIAENISNAELFSLGGWLTISDWMASDERHFSAGCDAPISASLALQSADGFCAKPVPNRSFSDLFGKNSPRPLQQLAHDACTGPGLYILEASMGEGKTEAALWMAQKLMAAGHARGVYFALPTQVTSNAIHFDRVLPFVEAGFETSEATAVTRLSHSNAWLLRNSYRSSANGTTEAYTAESWFNGPKRAFLAPFGAGTVDQALLGVLPVKHFFVRLAGLSGKVVILDEIHSYDTYTGTLIGKLLSHLRSLNCTVIVLSATLTNKLRQSLVESWTEDSCSTTALAGSLPPGHVRLSAISGKQAPLLHSCRPTGERAVALRFHEQDVTAVVAEIQSRIENGQRVLWIRNTVDNALEAAHLLGSKGVGLLHSRFTYDDRIENESVWLAKLKPGRGAGKGCVLVATQVAEQSLDLDADFLVCDLCPIDLLLQRLGRLWRHGNRTWRPSGCERAEAWIHGPLPTGSVDPDEQLFESFKALSIVYPSYHLLRTLETLIDRDQIRLPEDISDLLESTFQERPSEPSVAHEEALQELQEKEQDAENLATLISNVWRRPTSNTDDEERAQTRLIRFPTQPLVLLAKAHRDKREPLAFLNGQTASVPIPGDHKARLCFAEAVHRNTVKIPIWLLRNQPEWFPEECQAGSFERTAFGVLNQDGSVSPGSDSSDEDGNDRFLTYHNSRGLSILPHLRPKLVTHWETLCAEHEEEWAW